MVSLEGEAMEEEATLEENSMEKRRISLTYALCSEVFSLLLHEYSHAKIVSLIYKSLCKLNFILFYVIG